jgi:predicted cupin superfamily sugar epimerase
LIGFFLSSNSGGSGGFSVGVGLKDGSGKDTVVEGVTIWIGSSLVKRFQSKISLGWSPCDSSPGIGFFFLLVSPQDSSGVFILFFLKRISESFSSGSISIVISWVLKLWVVNDWSRVSSESVSPLIGFFLSSNSGGSGGFSVGVGLKDGSGKDTVVEGVTIWIGSRLVKTVWVSDGTGVIGPSVSPDISGLLFINGVLSSGFGISVGLKDRIRKDTVVHGVSVWDGSRLN